MSVCVRVPMHNFDQIKGFHEIGAQTVPQDATQYNIRELFSRQYYYWLSVCVL
jgi:hypothetical protein